MTRFYHIFILFNVHIIICILMPICIPFVQSPYINAWQCPGRGWRLLRLRGHAASLVASPLFIVVLGGRGALVELQGYDDRNCLTVFVDHLWNIFFWGISPVLTIVWPVFYSFFFFFFYMFEFLTMSSQWTYERVLSTWLCWRCFIFPRWLNHRCLRCCFCYFSPAGVYTASLSQTALLLMTFGSIGFCLKEASTIKSACVSSLLTVCIPSSCVDWFPKASCKLSC